MQSPLSSRQQCVHAAVATVCCVLQGEMPSPPQRGARERELREARDQLRDQHGEPPGLSSRTVALHARKHGVLVVVLMLLQHAVCACH